MWALCPTRGNTVSRNRKSKEEEATSPPERWRSRVGGSADLQRPTPMPGPKPAPHFRSCSDDRGHWARLHEYHNYLGPCTVVTWHSCGQQSTGLKKLSRQKLAERTVWFVIAWKLKYPVEYCNGTKSGSIVLYGTPAFPVSDTPGFSFTNSPPPETKEVFVKECIRFNISRASGLGFFYNRTKKLRVTTTESVASRHLVVLAPKAWDHQRTCWYLHLHSYPAQHSTRKPNEKIKCSRARNCVCHNTIRKRLYPRNITLV